MKTAVYSLHHPDLSPSLSPLQSEGARRGEEVPQGVRDGEPRHVVHRLPLEKGLPEIYRLSVSTPASRHRCLSPEIRGGGIVLHAFGFSSAQSRNCPLTLRPRPPPSSSTEPFQLWKEPKDSGVTFLHCRPGFQVLPRHSHRSPFWGKLQCS